MYAHARYYIILLRDCTKVIKVCNKIKEGRKEGRKEGQRVQGI